jgi:hypothetical protein
MKILESKFLWALTLGIGIVVAFVALTPRPIDMDLTKIGDGRKAIVFIYDPNLVASNQQATEMSNAEALLEGRAVFLIAKVGDPTSAEFRERYEARALDLLLFDESGELINRKIPVMSAEALISLVSNSSN